MKIACLQLNPILGAVQHNIDNANALLQNIKPGQLDLLVLPELAFTGYNFPSLEAIKPFLEPTTAGPTAQWAVNTARRLQCHVTVGYPEVSTSAAGQTMNYNATVTVSPLGEVLANYRKSFLYYTDETWAYEGPNGSALHSHTATSKPFLCGQLGRLGHVGHGICMDINPYQFTAPWRDFEFANTMLREGVRLVILSMAWLTHRLPHELEIEPDKPDMETVAYWRERFGPFIESAPREEIIVVFANRCGVEGNTSGTVHVENGAEAEEGDRVCYAGSSCVMRFQGGSVRLYDRGEGVAILGKNEQGLLVVDTLQHAKYSLQPGTI
ncbi:hypothetical protein LTR37_005947 [Vermiconidia calcicola]|uniref:Uncharacterized protein n=1 Tax=Vermiconidia calcicola TaxID=1690605 RepID=A0ACC3NHU1_9PEZI|nr:hypothetical protein LTR37_005947 [Vermiconidia calcicola]